MAAHAASIHRAAARPCGLLGYDENRVAVVFAALKRAAASMTHDPIEPYIDYPFTARSAHGNIVLRSAKDLRRQFPRLFNARVRAAILAQNLDDAFTNYQGVMIGRGEVWIGETCLDRACDKTRYVIRAINF